MNRILYDSSYGAWTVIGTLFRLKKTKRNCLYLSNLKIFEFHHIRWNISRKIQWTFEWNQFWPMHFAVYIFASNTFDRKNIHVPLYFLEIFWFLRTCIKTITESDHPNVDASVGHLKETALLSYFLIEDKKGLSLFTSEFYTLIENKLHERCKNTKLKVDYFNFGR